MNNERVMTLPSTAEEALEELEGIGQLMYVQGWRKAALVYVLTEPQQGRRTTSTSNRRSYTEFVELGITGLRTIDTVRLYRQRWEEYGDPSIKLGDSIVIPSDDWPPNGRNEGSRVSIDPKKAVEQVVEKHGKEAVAKAIADDTSLTAEVATQMEPVVTSSSGTSGGVVGQLDAMGTLDKYERLTLGLPEAFAAVAPFLRDGKIPLAGEILQEWDDRLELELMMIRQLKADIEVTK